MGQSHLPIDHIGIENGLSNSAVRSICQDRLGFIWIGTHDGLNRFDGSAFKIFTRNAGNANSLLDNWVNSIAEDRSGKLWIGTRSGINIYDPQTGNFTRVYFRDRVKKSLQPVGGFVKDIQIAANGDVFASVTGYGLIRFRKGTYDNGEVARLIYRGTELTDLNVNDILCSPQTNWVLVQGIGLCQVNNSNLLLVKNSGLADATSMVADGNTLWTAGPDGLAQISVESLKNVLRTGTLKNKFAQLPVKDLMNFPGEVWIATDGEGIFVYTKATGAIRSIATGFGKFSLSSEAVFSLYRDQESRIWIGTLRGGVNVLDPYKARFTTFEREPGNPNSLINNFVLSLKEVPGNKLWIGTDGGGLSILDRSSGKFENFKHQTSYSNSLSGHFITSIERDFKGSIWVSSYDGGIDRFQEFSHDFKRYNISKGPGKVPVTKFWTLYEDSDHNLWASSVESGLYRYNREKDIFELWESISNISVLSEDAEGRLWGGGGSGLVAIDKQRHKVINYSVKSWVRSILEDRYKNFWLGTDNGLILYDRAKKKIKKVFHTAQGLANDQVFAIQEDFQGNLWISTYNGLSRMQISTGIFKTYSQADGLQSNEFNFNAGLRLSSGELAFGGIKGLNIFFPESLNNEKKAPEIVLTGIRINNKAADLVPEFVKKGADQQILELRVPLAQAIFAFDYTAIEYPSANRIRYRFRMDGMDKGWNYPGASRTAIYTNFSPGSYTFRVNCTNSNGTWINKQVIVHITILPPWYRTWWAYLVYIAFTITLISIYLKYKFKQERLIYEVKLAKTEAEKEREIHEKRLQFFTGISHEFRTPLTLIINPIKDLLMRPVGESNDLNIIYRNARRLLSLVDQLLLFRKAESGISSMRVSRLDLYSLCLEVYLCFTQQAKSAGIQYNFMAENKGQTIFADREKLEIILFNLISNAIKFTPPGGAVNINIKDLPSSFEIIVSDTGCGIEENAKEKLFEKFYQSKSAGKPVKAGFGIGLYLVKQFALAHHGTINCHTEQEKGTVFTLNLLKGHLHFPNEIISADDSFESVLLQELKEDGLPEETLTEDTGHFKAENIFVDKKLILLVDDDIEIRNYLKSMLAHHYAVIESSDGETAMLIVKDKQPDLVICDVMMPGMNGIEWCSWLKRDPVLSHIPVILLTGSSSDESRLKGLHGGADDYLSKPFDNQVFMARVANLLTIRNNLRSYFYNEITLQKNDIIVSSEYRDFLAKCIKIVENSMIDPDFGTKSLCGKMGMSHSNLFRKVKSMSGYSISHFIRYIRLRKAAELLINTESNVNEVATICGFNSMRYFRTQFALLFGSTPSDFKRRNRPVFKKGDRIIH
ncbi:response regulator [Mucilaginibacter sp. UR6-1]|nr:response regulator [Mucilaginibacter sp. UR6-1]